VAQALPTSVSPPTITGEAQEGNTLTEVHGDWTGDPTTYRYQWQHCSSIGTVCADIAGATLQSYLLTDHDSGFTMRVEEWATNAAGTSNSPAVSAPSAQVTIAPEGLPVATAPPKVSGFAFVEQTLTVLQGGWTGQPSSYRNQWQRCTRGSGCTDIPMASGWTYVVSRADIGHTIRVLQWASYGAGEGGPSTSSATARVPSPVTVSTNADAGPGSLRQAVLDTDAQGGGTIVFALPAAERTISPSSLLPVVSAPTVIDGTTEPGYRGSPLVRLDGSSAPPGASDASSHGLQMTGGSSVVEGLQVTRWGMGIWLEGAGSNVIEGDYIGTDGYSKGLSNGTGIVVDSDGNTIGGTTRSARDVISYNSKDGVRISHSHNVVEGDYIGVDASGTKALMNGRDGVSLGHGSSNWVGGPVPGARDVISGNFDAGVLISEGQTNRNVVAGDYLGTDATGRTALPNGEGVLVQDGAWDNTIGGTDPGDRDVISGNSRDGVRIDGSGTGENTVQGDYIGTDASGTAPLPNGDPKAARGSSADAGVMIEQGANDNLIGGRDAAMADVISGNIHNGVELTDGGTTRNSVLADLIGTDATGKAALGNGSDGVLVRNGASGNAIGGGTVAEGDTIADNAWAGVQVDGTSEQDTILENAIFNNHHLGIELSGDGNGQALAPTITSVTTAGTGTTVSGTAGPGSLRVEVFANPNCADPEGKTFLAKATSGNGGWSVQVPSLGAGTGVTATATAGTGTSYFSACKTQTAGSTPLGKAEPGGRGWAADATRFAGKIGKRFIYVCPPDGTENPVWGTKTYTDDSSVCTAAVNYGLITIESGGTVTIEMRAGLASYPGSMRNGTTTSSYKSWDSSFTFVGQPIYNTDVGYGGGSWDADASDFRGQNGQRYLYVCPPGGSAGDIWGTGTYTDDSSVCTAAVHVGRITLAKGGYVTIEVQPGASSYTGSTQNGITSEDYGPWTGSFTFVTS
jgi:hypothetical protein